MCITRRRAADARDIILELCRSAGAKLVTKGKSMVSEEIGLNAHLEAAGIEAVETDLGEYIVQMRGEPPSHIIAPVIHLNKEPDRGGLSPRACSDLPHERALDRARRSRRRGARVLREKFIAADVGITGANLLIAETGSSMVVTNEGNGDLTQTLPRMHIVIASIEKIVPTLEDAVTILRLLARSATGQEITTYTTFATGPRRDGDPDGPAAYTWSCSTTAGARCSAANSPTCCAASAAAPASIIARSIGAIGGHAYGSIYPGPMGAVLTPQLEASTGPAICPMLRAFAAGARRSARWTFRCPT